ncbi:MAG: hypothetical protein GWM90_29235 [Gemmatimonadetes bacterium]|nr:hypothetical protein [Gemmatimonadota bacterium]NIQ59131.1 hypothetical protein [Gemmatimonadota bacterium]NIU79335.1 hypothetical protein [Gammaproteobacteria bacterium]NIX48005.1 hypothetical protein [Gemmatimonadota bacterium]NIY12377.1 hypothetical protein [Gemmatimonadota bacterium]
MKRIAVLTLALALAGWASPVAASGCTEDYMMCLNDNWGMNAIIRTIADFACFDDYTVCVSRRILGL